MGSACCSNGDDPQTNQTNTDTPKMGRRAHTFYPKPDGRTNSIISVSSTDSNDEFDLNDSTSFQPYNTNDIVLPTTQSAQKAINGFKTAVQNGNDSLVMYFMETYPTLDLLDTQFDFGNHALHIAVQNTSYNLILYLLTNGMSPNQQNDIGETALHVGVRTNNLKIVTLLTKYSADPKIQNVNLETPLTIATGHKYYDIIELLAPHTHQLFFSQLQTVNNMINCENDDHEFESDQSDPFINLSRKHTKVALQEIRDITCEKNRLPKLEGFLQKKQPQIPYKWQRRWVIVKDSYILWSDIQRNIVNTKNIKERKKFNNSINLMRITNVQPVIKSKSQRKFVIEVGGYGVKNKKQTYLWKCATKNDRDLWVQGLKEHIRHLKSIVSYLGANN